MNYLLNECPGYDSNDCYCTCRSCNRNELGQKLKCWEVPTEKCLTKQIVEENDLFERFGVAYIEESEEN